MVNKLYVFLGLVVLVFGLSLAVAQENIGEESNIIPNATSREGLPSEEGNVTLEGAAFPVPHSLKDDISQYRRSMPELPVNAFLLVAKDNLSLVFTHEKVSKGLATVEGKKLSYNLPWKNTELSVIKADTVSVRKEGDPATINDILSNPDAYRLELVKLDTTLRQVSTLYDPDDGSGIEFPITTGVVVNSPRNPVDFVDDMSRKVREFHDNPSRSVADRLLGDTPRQHLYTFNFQEDFWIDSKAEVNGIVLYPQGTVVDLIENLETSELELVHTDKNVLLYVVKTDMKATHVTSVNEITTHSKKYMGKVVKFTAFGKGGTTSIQEMIKKSGKYPPVDVLLHGVVAWNSISVPPERNDIILTTGASSHHQDRVFAPVEGKFNYIGKIVSSKQVNESLPEGLALITYARNKTGELDYEKLPESAKEMIKREYSNLNASLGGAAPIEISTPKETAPTPTATPTATPTPTLQSHYPGKCTQLEDLIEKKKHYERLYNLSEEELEEKGYSKGREGIKKVLEKLEERIRNIKPECENYTNYTAYTNRCAELEDLIVKKKHYKHLYSLSEEELKKTGYPQGREEVKKILEKLEERIRECEEVRSRVIQGNISRINGTPKYTNRCTQLKDLIVKKKHYKHLYNLSDRELKKRGDKGREEVKEILEKLEERIRECEEITARSGGRKGQGVNVSQERYPVVKPSNVSITKPIVAESGREITDYYTSKITTIMKKETNVEQQVKELKELRNEVDKLIEELIKSKDEINTEEVDELVSKVKIKPGKIKADNAIVNSTNKTIITKVNKKNLTIKPTKLHVTIQEGKYEIKAPEIKVQNKTLVVGNSTVKLTASDIVEKTKVEPKDIELKEENAKAVYKIKADENRKLFGFIPVKVEKDMTVDAGDREVKVLKEKRPWWSFLTSK